MLTFQSLELWSSITVQDGPIEIPGRYIPAFISEKPPVSTYNQYLWTAKWWKMTVLRQTGHLFDEKWTVLTGKIEISKSAERSKTIEIKVYP